MHRFAVDPENVCGDRVVFSKDQCHQLHSVLRFRPGQQLVVVRFGEADLLVELTCVERKQATGVIVDRRRVNESGPCVVVAQAVIKSQKMDLVVQKVSELGAAIIVPVICDRSLPRLDENRRLRWQRIAREAAEQCARGSEPHVTGPVTFDNAVTEERRCLELICDEQEMERGISDVIVDSPPRRIKLFVGPEGGFTDRERQIARSAGVIAVGLGPLVLRAETAAVSAVAVAMYRWGKLGSPAVDQSW